MRHLLILISAFLSAGAIAQQTEGQIQQMKAFADQMPVGNASAKFSTPLKTFEAYFSALAQLDASEYQCMTPHAIRGLLGVDVLTDEDLSKIKTGQRDSKQRDYSLIEFRYSTDALRPKLLFAYSYRYPETDGRLITAIERQELTFARAEIGWKIDSVDEQPTP